MKKRFYVGVDVGSTSCRIVVMDTDGTVVLEKTVPTASEQIEKVFKGLDGDVHVHLEACELAAWVRSVIKPLVNRVVVGHPKTNAWIGKDPRKSDEVDARKLAELIRINRVHEVHYPDDPERIRFKQMVQQYEHLTTEEARIKQRIKSSFRQQGIIAVGEAVYGEVGRAEWIEKVSSLQMRQAIELQYVLMDQAVATQVQTRKLMFAMAKRYPEVALIETIPGMGKICACRFVAYVFDPCRFSSRSDLWSYCGLAVMHPTSDGKPVSAPHLDRRSGNPHLKDVSRKAYMGAMRCQKENAFQRSRQAAIRGGADPDHARLSTQRKIVAVCRAVWKSGRKYQEMGEIR